MVPTNQITPRVGFQFKQKFDLEFETRFDPNLQKIISFDLSVQKEQTIYRWDP
jgi:hypothetical protein